MGTDFRRCGEIDEEMKQKLNEMYVGRLIHILSHTMKRHNPAEVMENDDLTTMQKHVLKFILLETMHRDLYQKDIEEEFQIRKPTVTGILKLMEKNGWFIGYVETSDNSYYFATNIQSDSNATGKKAFEITSDGGTSGGTNLKGCYEGNSAKDETALRSGLDSTCPGWEDIYTKSKKWGDNGKTSGITVIIKVTSDGGVSVSYKPDKFAAYMGSGE